jgi:multiple antibiotic resistance protein
MLLVWKSFVLAFTALLPLVNPLGSALIFLGLVGQQPIGVYRSLSRKIAINCVLFFAIIQLLGSGLLAFFSISLPIVQLAGGIVIASIGWNLLNQADSSPTPDKTQAAQEMEGSSIKSTLEDKAFYPFTFPITAGPGCIVVMLTISARTVQPTVGQTVIAHLGVFLAAVVLSLSVYLCYSRAQRIANAVSPGTAHGILRVIAFILVCIGVQIAWNGLSVLLASILKSAPIIAS